MYMCLKCVCVCVCVVSFHTDLKSYLFSTVGNWFLSLISALSIKAPLHRLCSITLMDKIFIYYFFPSGSGQDLGPASAGLTSLNPSGIDSLFFRLNPGTL